MRHPLPLRSRVAVGFAVLGFGLSAAFAAATWFIAEDYEHLVVAAVLRAEAADLQRRLHDDPGTALPSGPWLSGFLINSVEAEHLPPGLHGLPPGVHEPKLPGRDGLHASVFDLDGQRFLLLVDLGEVEALEYYLVVVMLLVVLGGTALSGWLGWWLSGHALAPLRRVADAVDALPPQARPTHLSDRLANDELGRVAAAIDRYQTRLLAREARDRAFFADASHELRTPLAVARGAAEVLADQRQVDDAEARARARLARGLDDLEHRLRVVMLVARGAADADNAVEIGSVLAFVSERVRKRAEARGLALHLDCPASASWPCVRAQPAAVEAMLSGLLQALADHARTGSIELRPAADGMLMRPCTAGSPAERGDQGPALGLLERLAEAMGWRLESATMGECFEISLHWPSTSVVSRLREGPGQDLRC